MSHSPSLPRQCPPGRLIQPECAGKATKAAYHVLNRSPESLIGILGHISWKVPVAFQRGKAWIVSATVGRTSGSASGLSHLTFGFSLPSLAGSPKKVRAANTMLKSWQTWPFG